MKNEFEGISFIIPAFNEEKYIGKTLESILKFSGVISTEFEIIVVDNGSEDKTPSIAENYPCRIFRIEKSKVSSARNIGASKAKFDLYAFIDGDTVLTNKWALEINEFLSAYTPENRVITGCTVSIPPDPSWIEKAWFDNSSNSHIGGANIICSKSYFNDVGGFDENLETGEDYDFCKKADRFNLEFVINNNFEAIHLGFPSNITEFAKREVWHGKGDCKSLKTFFTSKVCIVSLLYVMILFASIILFFSRSYLEAAIFISLLSILNFLVTIKRFGLLSFDIFTYNYFLNFIYFVCRSVSVLSVLKDKFR